MKTDNYNRVVHLNYMSQHLGMMLNIDPEDVKKAASVNTDGPLELFSAKLNGHDLNIGVLSITDPDASHVCVSADFCNLLAAVGAGIFAIFTVNVFRGILPNPDTDRSERWISARNEYRKRQYFAPMPSEKLMAQDVLNNIRYTLGL